MGCSQSTLFGGRPSRRRKAWVRPHNPRHQRQITGACLLEDQGDYGSLFAHMQHDGVGGEYTDEQRWLEQGGPYRPVDIDDYLARC